MSNLTSEDFIKKAQDLSLFQFADSEVIQGILFSWANSFQDVEDAALAFHQININNAVGQQLDQLYGELFGIPRQARDDDQYRSAILAKISTFGSDGTTEDLLSNLRSITGSDEYVTFFEHYPADVHAWLGDGYSLYTYGEVQDLVQAGVNIRLIVDNQFDSFVMSEIYQDDADLQVTLSGTETDLQINHEGIDCDLQVTIPQIDAGDIQKAILPELEEIDENIAYVSLAELLWTTDLSDPLGIPLGFSGDQSGQLLLSGDQQGTGNDTLLI